MTTPRRQPPTAAENNSGWRESAACASVDADLFFPVPHTNGWKKQTKEAKAVCAACPVKQLCLDWALDTAQPAGIWGGKSELERRALRGLPESQKQRCLDRQVWIEKQLAAGVSQRAIAARLRVTRVTLYRAITRFEEERATAEGVTAA
jgi:WhiB family redox-sensing transcriptional regulator